MNYILEIENYVRMSGVVKEYVEALIFHTILKLLVLIEILRTSHISNYSLFKHPKIFGNDL